MPYEVVNAQFRTELEARWSVFFDHLRVPWAYEPVTFRDHAGRRCTPPFWLPRERIWFHPGPAQEVPCWWPNFAAAVGGRPEELALWWDERWRLWWGDREDEVDVALRVEVGEEWRGTTLVDVDGMIPDGYGGSDSYGPWRFHAHLGCFTACDVPYQWTICPQCDCFGAEFCGYAERLACTCIDDRERTKFAGAGDARLMAAYRAAAEADFQFLGNSAQRPVVREALVNLEGAALAQQRCVGACHSMADVARTELPEEFAAYIIGEDADTLCGACPGFVCSGCGEKPAAAPGGSCRSCDPVPLLTASRGRELLNEKLTELGRRKKAPLRAIHPVANKAMGVRRRSDARLEHLAVGLTRADLWLAEPDMLHLTPPSLPEEAIQALAGHEVRSEITARIGPLCRALRGERPATVQMRINDATGVKARADATDDQLRAGLRQVVAWLAEPDLLKR